MSKPKTRAKIALRGLRESLGVTQQEIAEATGMQQSEISRFERRGDYHVSTLRRIVAALGGKLELVVRFGSKRLPLE